MGSNAAVEPIYMMSFTIGAVLVCLTCLVYMALHHRYDKFQSKVFIAIIVDLIVTALSDMTAEFVRSYAFGSAAAAGAVDAACFVYFASHAALAPIFFMYVTIICRVSIRRDHGRNVLFAIPFLLTELLVFSNPFTHYVYSYGSDLVMIRNWGMIIEYCVGILYLVLALVQLVMRWRALTPVKRRAIAYFFSVAGVGIIVQLLVPAMRVELFAESFAVLGVMMSIENEVDLIDPEAGVYNRYALEMDLGMYASLPDPFYVIAVRVTNADAFAHMGGSVQVAQFMTTSLTSYFKTVIPWYRVYRTAPARFVLVDPYLNREEASELAHTIAKRFEQSWNYLDVEINLNAVVALACVPDDLGSADDVFYLVDTPVPPVAGKDVLEGGDLGYLMRRAEVERAVQRGLDEGGYEVYYQPIYRADGTAYALEALMRLHDRVLGDVPPFEFIEVAERMGVVEDIGDFALSEACAFMASGVPQSLGIHHVSVNLSVIQCMKVDFAEHANRVVASYDVDPRVVSYEITESVAAGNIELLGGVIGQLKESGHRFAMDDYGTGYSNMHSLVALDFDVVKIDKSVLWDAEKSDTGTVILENSVKTMRDVGYEVLVEGVETAKQVNALRRLGIDYYQGFYFAKPMPKQTLVKFLEQRPV